MKKRIISLALALCMIIALLPSIPLVSADNGYTFFYDLNPKKITSDGNPYVYDKELFGSEYTQTHNMWEYLSKTTGAVRGYPVGSKFGWQISSSKAGTYVAIELNIPEAGEYTATYNYGAHKVGALGSLYLLPPSVTDIAAGIADDTYKLNSDNIDYDQGVAGATEMPLLTLDKKVTVTDQTKGKWKLIIYCVDKVRNWAMYPISFTLSSGNGAIPMDISADCNEVILGESEEITLSGYMSDGTGFAASKVDSIVYTVKDGNPDVASVDANGKVKGIKTGTEVITVTVTAGTHTVSDEVTVVVDDIVTNGNYTFKYDFNPKKITAATPAVNETALFGSEYAQTYNMWQYLTKTTGAVRGYAFGTQYGWQISSNASGNYVAVELNIPEAGKYTATYIYGAHTVGATGDLYLLPPSVTDIAAGIADDTYKLNSEPIDYDQGVPGAREMAPLTLPKKVVVKENMTGKWKLIIRCVDKVRNWAMYPGSLTLSAGSDVLPLGVTAEYDNSSALRINETRKISASAYMSDGETLTVADAGTVSYILKEGGEHASVDADGVVTGLSEGTAKIAVSVTKNGATVESKPVEVSVSSKVFSLADYTLKYDFSKTGSNIRFEEIPEEKTNNFWMPHSYSSPISTLRSTGYGLQLGTNVDQWVALKLYIPVAGIYKTRFCNLTGTSGGIGELYIVDGDTADVGGALSTAQKLGKVCFYSSSTIYNNYSDLNNVEFEEAGEHLLVFKATAKGDGINNVGSYNMYPTSIEFIGADDAQTAVTSLFVSKSDIELSIGETDTVSVTEAWLSDVRKATSEDYTVSFDSSDDNVATVDNGLITAVGAGDAVVTVTATRGESSVSRKVKVAVLPETYSGFTAKYDLTANADFATASYAATKNLWKYSSASGAVTVNDGYISFGESADSYAEIKVNVPVSGEYQIKLSHAQSASGAVGAVYLDGTEVGEVDYSAASGEVKLAVKNITNGEHTIKLACKDGANGFVQSPSAITLYGGKKLAPVDADLSFKNNAARVTKIYLSDGSELAVENASVSYSMVSDSNAEINAETGSVAAGSTDAEGDITAKIKYNNIEYFETLENAVIRGIDESAYTLNYVFNKADLTDHTRLLGVDYDKTYGFWKYHSSNFENTSIKKVSYGFYLSLADKKWAAITIYVPAPGRYTTTLNYLCGSSGGKGEIHILPGDTVDIETAIANGESQKLSDVISFYEPASTNRSASLRDANFFEAGEYIVVFRSVGKGAEGSWNMYPTGLVFNEAAANPTLQSVVADDVEIRVGETLEAAPRAVYLSDYTTAAAGTYELMLQSGDSETVTAANASVTGVKKGVTSLGYTVKKDGVSVKASAGITVFPETYSGFNAVYDLTANDGFASATYENTHNLWKYLSGDNVEVGENSVSFGTGTASVEIFVPVAGEYDVRLSYDKASDGALGAVSINGQKIGTVDYNATEATAENAVLGSYNFAEAGNYTVEFTCESSQSGTKQLPGVLTLYGGRKVAPVDADVNFAFNIATVTKIYMSDGSELSPEEAVVRYRMVSDSNAEINLETGSITADSEDAEATVTATITYNGVSYPKSVDVTVRGITESPYNLNYNFTDADINVEEPLWGVKFSQTKGFWQYNSAKTETASNRLKSYGFYLSIAAEHWVAFDIYVPAPGRYTAELTHLAGSSGGFGEVHILPAGTTDIDAAIANGNSQNLGVVNSYNPTTIYPTTTLRDANFFEAGEYILVFKSIAKGAGGSAAMFPQSLTFNKAKDKYVLQSVFANDYELEKDEERVISVNKVYYSDYSEASIGEYTMNAFTADENVAVVNNGILRGVGEGTTTLMVTATNSDGTVKTVKNVNVLNVGASGYTMRYDFALSKAQSYKESVYTDTYNFWKFDSSKADNLNVDTDNGIVSFGESAEDYVAYEINVPFSGKYKIELAHGTSPDGAVGSVYLGKSIADAVEVGEVDYSGEAAFDSVTALAETEFDTAGKYYVIFKYKSGTGFAQHPGALSLVGGGKTMPMGVEITADGNLVTAEYAVMSDGSILSLDRTDADYSLEDSTVGIINSKTGKITASSVGGTTKAVASVVINGAAARGETSVTVLPEEYTVSDAYANYRFYEHSASWAQPLRAPDDKYSNYDIRGITREDTDGNWAWFGSSPGTASRSGIAYAYTANESVPRLHLTVYKNEWVGFEIDVPAAGTYLASMTSAKGNRPDAGQADIYIVPFTENATSEAVNGMLTAKNYVGRVDFAEKSITSGTWVNDVKDVLGAVELNVAGKYFVVFKSATGDLAMTLTPKMLILDGSSNKIASVGISLDKDTYEVGEEGTSEFTAKLLDGTEPNLSGAGVVYASSDESVATFEDGKIKAISKGTAKLSVTVIYGGERISASKTITVTDAADVVGIELSADSYGFTEERLVLSVNKLLSSGNKLPLGDIPVTFEILSGDAEIVNSNRLIAHTPGTVEVRAKAVVSREERISQPISINIKQRTQKTASTYYTEERRTAAQKNMQTYDWAKSSLKTTLGYADKFLETYEYLYDHMVGEGLPRSQRVGEEADPDMYRRCRYCGVDITTLYGSGASGAYDVDIYNNKWKIKCPDCRRNFPSNDFGSFFELGKDEYGCFDVNVARQKHHEMLFHADGSVCDCKAPTEEYTPEWYIFYGYGNPKGFLYNESYSEVRESNKDPRGEAITWNGETGADLGTYTSPKTGEVWTGGSIWGVDDGLGYLPGRTYANGANERHSYIAVYMHELWQQVDYTVRWLNRGYVFSGDPRYGRAGAIILDRMADLYPTFEQKQWDNMYLVSHGGSGFGKIFGCINDCEYATSWSTDADGLYPIVMANDPEVIAFLSEKAQTFGFKSKTGNPKTSGEKIWANVEDGLLREVYKSVKNGNLNGNYGQEQKALAAAALVLANEPESRDIINFLYKPGQNYNRGSTSETTGGNLSVQFIDVIDRDGMGNEAAPNYNLGWIADLYECADMLSMYSEEYDLYKDVKFAKMFTAAIPVVLTDDHTVQVGDTSWPASIAISGDMELIKKGFMHLKDTNLGNELAEYIYRQNGYKVDGLHYDHFHPDPDSLQDDVLACIDDDVLPRSEMMAGYGFAVLRNGAEYKSANLSTYNNNMRDYWLYFGRNAGHGHEDSLTLGIEAFGLNMAPDNGTPEVKSSTDQNRYQWVEPTISHNTITVNEKGQDDIGLHGYPLHFDSSDEVQLMDIDASKAYTTTSIYRRTLVMVDAGDDVSYGVDFFRVKGGDDHLYSFHSQSEEIYETEGLGTIEYQTDDGTANGNYVGSYAGANVDFGPDPSKTHVKSAWHYPAGYTWMKNVRRAKDVGKFAVDFKVTDYRKVLKDGNGLHLRMTMLNDFDLQEVALTSGYVTRTSGTKGLPETFEYVIARRQGKNLDSLYTTVYEPYRNDRYILDMEAIDNITSQGTEKPDDTVKAVKVIRKAEDGTAGRVDYIIYATNNSVLYTITDDQNNADPTDDVSFNFRGFVGVYSLNADGFNIYNYVHDGDVIGDVTDAPKAVSGKVVDFTKTLTFNNNVVISTDSSVDPAALKGKYLFVENDGKQNAVYEIKSAEAISGGINLNIGATTLIRGLKDTSDPSSYVFNIAKGQLVSIPLSAEDDNGPVFAGSESELTATAGSTLEMSVNATADGGASVEYIATTLPRGASLDKATGKITWKPTASQIGTNHFAITARDEYGRETTEHFNVIVYGSTTGAPSQGEDNTGSTDSTETPSGGGGGGGGGGAAPAPDEDDNANTPSDDETTQPDDGGNTDVPSKGFVDLGNHAWASDAINELAEAGIIKGTSETTFSPANNITRADFAILLVRAFGLESDNTENFADVSESDYFAAELAIARNCGIVDGIGDNKYAPRNTITRQDMMVIVYRALQVLEKMPSPRGKGGPLAVDEVGRTYPDFTKVAPYATDAVSALITEGLVNGKNGLIDPMSYTTRAEVAVLIKRILDYIK